MPEPTDMILPLLGEMCGETRLGFEEMRTRFLSSDERLEAIDARLRAVEKIVKAQREAFEGDSVLGRYAAKEVEGRLVALEHDVEAMKRKS